MYFNVVNYAALKRSDHIKLLEEKDQKIQHLLFELEQLKRVLFGSKSERFIGTPSPEQLKLFAALQEELAAVQEEQISYKRKKVNRKPKRTKLPDTLERVVTVLEPEEDVSQMEKIGEQVTEKLSIIPAKAFVEQTVRPKYKDKKGAFHIAELPSDPFPKSIASAHLAAHIAVQKYVDHQPLYRQSKIWKRQQVDLPRSTMNDIIRKGAKLLEPLYNAMVSKAMQGTYLMADESSIPVLGTTPKHEKIKKGCMLVKVAPLESIAVMEFIGTKEKENITKSLGVFEGYLQVDGNVSYEALGASKKVTLMHCLVHARRYFEKAKEYDSVKSNEMLEMIQQLYQIERQIKEEPPDMKYHMRQKHSKPVTIKMKKWLEDNLELYPPDSPMTKAIRYMLKRWAGLTVYLTNGELRPDNNLIENQIRPLALGRKNFMFAGSENGAKYAAIFYTLFATCKINHINPYDYLVDVFKKISDYPVNKIHELIPHKNYKFS